jgi:hypothetical protein
MKKLFKKPVVGFGTAPNPLDLAHLTPEHTVDSSDDDNHLLSDFGIKTLVSWRGTEVRPPNVFNTAGAKP